MQEGPDQTAHPSNLIGAIINHFMTRVTNKIVPHRKRSFAFIRVLVSLNVDDKYLRSVQRNLSCGHFTCNSLHHCSLYILIISSIRSRYLVSFGEGMRFLF